MDLQAATSHLEPAPASTLTKPRGNHAIVIADSKKVLVCVLVMLAHILVNLSTAPQNTLLRIRQLNCLGFFASQGRRFWLWGAILRGKRANFFG